MCPTHTDYKHRAVCERCLLGFEYELVLGVQNIVSVRFASGHQAAHYAAGQPILGGAVVPSERGLLLTGGAEARKHRGVVCPEHIPVRGTELLGRPEKLVVVVESSNSGGK